MSTIVLLFPVAFTALKLAGIAYLRKLNQFVGQILIRRNESTGWRVTPSAPTRPRRLCRKLIVVEVSVSSATVSRSCGGGASRVSYLT
jgi:hypothetical protein